MLIKKASVFLKVTAVTVTAVFLWNQIVWAGDLTSTPLSSQNTIDPISPIGDSQIVDTRQTQMESLIAKKQDIENFISQPNVLTTTYDEISEPCFEIISESGDKIIYVNGKIDSIETYDGMLITDITLNDENALVAAKIKYSDNKELLIQSGKVKSLSLADGTKYTYDNEGLLESIEYIDGRVETFEYKKDIDENVQETILKDNEKSVYYDSENNITKTRYKTGKVIEYDAGIITRIIHEDGTILIYKKLENEEKSCLYEIESNGNKYHIENGKISGIEYKYGDILTGVVFNADGKFIEGTVEKADGTKYKIKNGRLISFETPAEQLKVNYEYELDDMQNIVICNVTVQQENTIRTYRYIKEDNTIIIEEAGSEYHYDENWNLLTVKDANGEYQAKYDNTGFYAGTTFTAYDGMTKAYNKDGKLEEIKLSDGTVYKYFTEGDDTGKLESLEKADGSEYTYDYEINDFEELEVTQRQGISVGDIYETIYSTTSVSYDKNPTFKFNLNFDSSASYNNLSANASYYKYNDKYINLSMSMGTNSSYVYYYEYNYVTKQRDSKNTNINVKIKKNTEYTGEFIWKEDGVYLYMYETGTSRPEKEAYRLTTLNWNPTFRVSGNNARVRVDSLSDGQFYYKKEIRSNISNSDTEIDSEYSTEYNTVFSFDDSNSYKYLYYYAYGRTEDGYSRLSV
ncbi:MAG: hypothetical protein ABIH09_05070, partial [Candidatus Omnitrophota bacterium]